MRYFLFGLLISIFGHFANGQAMQDFRDNYEQETVFWKGGNLMKDGRKLKLKHFKAELLKYQDSKFEFELHRRYDNQAWLWYGVSLAGMLYAASTDDQNLAVPALGLSIGALVPFFIFKNKANNSLHKSIWYYNRDVTFANQPGYCLVRQYGIG